MAEQQPDHPVQPTTAGRLLLASVCLIPVAILVLHASSYLPFLSDDSLISLRYVQRLLAGHGLTWTDGQPVEGYSNLLWILLVAVPGAFGLDLIISARLLGLAAMAAALVAGACTPLREQQRSQRLLGLLLGLSLTALSAPAAVWAIGGLEQPLVAALLAASLTLGYHLLRAGEGGGDGTLLALSLCLGLLCLSRPDGPIFVVTITAAILLPRRRRRVAAGLRLLALPVLLVGGQLVFRLLYYGEWLPNPALVKLGLSPQRLAQGVRYVGQGLAATAPLSLLAMVMVVYLLSRHRSRQRGLLLLLTGGAWLGYVGFIGGDIFPAWRHLVPALVVFCLATCDGVSEILGSMRRQIATAVLILLWITLGALQLAIGWHDGEAERARQELWEWDGKKVGLMLRRAFNDQQPLFAVAAAGCLPYWSQLPAVDMLGLNDHYLPRHPPEGFGSGQLAHELGDGAYVLGRQPDLIAFCGPVGGLDGCYLSEVQLLELDEFHRQYTPVRFQVDEQVLAVLWIRRQSKRIGIRQTPAGLLVPAYLLQQAPSTLVLPDEEGRLVVPISRSHPATAALELPPGDWQARVVSSGPPAMAEVRQRVGEGRTTVLVRGSADEPTMVRHLLLEPGTEPSPVSSTG